MRSNVSFYKEEGKGILMANRVLRLAVATISALAISAVIFYVALVACHWLGLL
jgi:hypothetical protein